MRSLRLWVYGLICSVCVVAFANAQYVSQVVNYVLPIATSSLLGGVKPDGTTILNTAGAISVAATTISGTSCTPGGACTVTPAVTAKVINSTYDLTTASGTQVVSGFGFTPSSCDGFGAVNGVAAGTYQTFGSHVDSSFVQSSINGVTGFINVDTTRFFIVQDITGGNAQLGVVSSFGSGTVSILWTKIGSLTGTFSFSIRCFK